MDSEQLKTLIFLLSKEHREKMIFKGFLSLDGDMKLKFASENNENDVRVVSFSEGRSIINESIAEVLKI